MKNHSMIRLLSVFAILIFFLAVEVQGVAAQPPAPVPVSPAGGSTIVVPTFSWQASSGAAKYQIEVGPQSDPNTVYWSAETVNLTLTPNDADKFAPNSLYWRVRALDSGDVAGPWSSKINFTKIISAPTLVSPTDASTLIKPVLEWQTVQGAAYYKVELSTSSTFITIEETYTTYNTRITPDDTLPHGIHFWRVSGVDADGHAGTLSAGWSFTKQIPAPTLTSPNNGHLNIHVPTLVWQSVEGAAYYQIELSTSDTFVPLEETYTTYNTQITPVDTFAHGLHYWRVRGVDADDHLGTPSAGWSFTKGTDGPVLISPGVNAAITTPTIEWAQVDGAAFYKLELSVASDFNPILATYTTYNLQITPVDALSLGIYYWRVSGVDSNGHVGDNYWRKFTLNALPAPVDVTPQLSTPANLATITTDPTFSWSRVVGAARYHLIVSAEADFSPQYDSVYLDYNSYTPYTPGMHDAYVNGTYYWKVEARNASNVVIATSAAFSFTKQESLPLTAPVNGAAGLVVDPTFQWSQIVGADRYHLIVSTEADFSPEYDSVYLDYNSYTPYTPGLHDVYVNGTYYWKVEARNSANTTMTTSEGRSFTKQEPVLLSAPADGATGLVVDPTFQWSEVLGADRYHLIVSTEADFDPQYDSVYLDYNSYTPYTPGLHDAYVNGIYYWKVEARNSANSIINTSSGRSFTKQETLPLIAPADGATIPVTPTFQWSQIVGADRYHLIVSTEADFIPQYDSVYLDYNSYTPYTPGLQDAYALGVYFWKVEARSSANTTITTSSTRTFSIGENYNLFLPVTIKGSS